MMLFYTDIYTVVLFKPSVQNVKYSMHQVNYKSKVSSVLQED